MSGMDFLNCFHWASPESRTSFPGSSESPEESSAGPLTLAGWWDLRKTTGNISHFHKNFTLPLFIWPSISSLPEAILPQSCPQPGLHILLRMGDLEASVYLARLVALLPLGLLHRCTPAPSQNCLLPPGFRALPEMAPGL